MAVSPLQYFPFLFAVRLTLGSGLMVILAGLLVALHPEALITFTAYGKLSFT